jgi:2-C-methyl-D-erythritol 2,4-cyclodiphosphate synthase
MHMPYLNTALSHLFASAGWDTHAWWPVVLSSLAASRISPPVGFGPSDADVLLHAITDALPGGCARKILAAISPFSMHVSRADSRELLWWASVAARGWRIGNIDAATVIAQAPSWRLTSMP